MLSNINSIVPIFDFTIREREDEVEVAEKVVRRGLSTSQLRSERSKRKRLNKIARKSRAINAKRR